MQIGRKWGKRIYLRIESGFSFGNVPETFNIKNTYEDGSVEHEEEWGEDSERFKNLTRLGIPIFNIGLELRF